MHVRVMKFQPKVVKLLNYQSKLHLARHYGNLPPPYKAKYEVTEEKDSVLYKRAFWDIMDGAREFLRHPFSGLRRASPYYTERQIDVLIIGGGPIGSSIAYFLKEACRNGLSVAIVDKNLAKRDDIMVNGEYDQRIPVLAMGGLRQSFSVETHIQMARFAASFLRQVDHYLNVPALGPVDINYTPFGYLTLASKEGAEHLKENHRLQTRFGVKQELVTQFQLKRRFPWLNTDDLEIASHGLIHEGWIDPWKLTTAFRNRAMALGAHLIDGEVVEFIPRIAPEFIVDGYPAFEYVAYNDARIKYHKLGTIINIEFAMCINAAGSEANDVLDMLNIDKSKSGYKSYTLPIEKRKRYLYHFDAPGGPGLAAPMIIDYNGLFVRRNGLTNSYVCGMEPSILDENDQHDKLSKEEYFEKIVWPCLAYRIPAFEKLKLRNSYECWYDFNTFDENPIIGALPTIFNFMMATASTGYGVMQAPAIGNAIKEMIVTGKPTVVDWEQFSYDRIIVNEPVLGKVVA